MSIFGSLLQKAYWRGVPFSVQAQEVRKGRKIAVHDYPFRDGGWVEDMGRAQQIYRFTGYLIGDFAPVMQLALDAACEMPGVGVLVHPTIGVVRVALLSASTSVRKERLRVIEVQFEFIEQGTSIFPSIIKSAISDVLGYVGDAIGAANTDLLAIAFSVVVVGAGIAAAVSTTSEFGSSSSAAAADPAALISMAAGLQPPTADVTYGRFADASVLAALPAGTTVPDLQAKIAAQRDVVAGGVAAAIATVAAFAPISGMSIVADSIATMVEQVRATMTNPADQVRTLLSLSSFKGEAAIVTSPLQVAIAAICRRACLVSLARAAVGYRLTSYDEASALRELLSNAFDIEITAAGDAGQDATYDALRNLRSAVIGDITTRAASLPLVRTVTLPSSLPSLVIGYRIYQDASRSDDVAARAAAIHPAFCATTIQLLAA